MDTEKYKSIALNMETYKKLRTLSDEQFEMPQSLAKTASYFIDNAFITLYRGLPSAVPGGSCIQYTVINTFLTFNIV